MSSVPAEQNECEPDIGFPFCTSRDEHLSARNPSECDLFVARVACKFSSDALLRHYYTLVYKNTGSYKGAAEVLEIDWRTVRDKVDPELLKGFLLTDSSQRSPLS